MRKGKAVVEPITDEYISRLAGLTGTKGRLLTALKEEKARERSGLPDPVATGDSAASITPPRRE